MSQGLLLGLVLFACVASASACSSSTDAPGASPPVTTDSVAAEAKADDAIVSVDTAKTDTVVPPGDAPTSEASVDDTAVGDDASAEASLADAVGVETDVASTEAAATDATGDDATASGDALVSTDTTVSTDATASTDTTVSVDTADPETAVSTDAVVTAETAETAAETSTPIAWGSACTRGASCATISGEVGGCLVSYGQPYCSHSCNAQADWSLCEGGLGVCVPPGTPGGNKVCVKKCGDTEKTTCGAGASCAFLGLRSSEAGLLPVGACVPDCTATGADACAGSGTACDTDRRTCSDIGCPDGCPTGSTCSGSACLPSPTVTPLYGSCKKQAAGVSNGCASGLCWAEPSPATGFCGTFCNTDSGDTTCGTGGVCWAGNSRLGLADVVDSGLTAGYEPSFRVVGGRTAGACIKKCGDTSECPSGFFCGSVNGQHACVPGANERATPAAGSGIPGSVCKANGDCVSGSCLKATGYVDGICSRANTSTACPSGTVALSASSLQCTPTCTGSLHRECRSSLVCAVSGATCAVGWVCRDNADCDTGYTCDQGASECRVAVSTALGSVGDTCTSGTNCKGVCQAATSPDAGSVVWPGGYCSSGCTILPELADTCPAGSICNAGTIGSYGACLDLCDSSGTPSRFGACRTGYKCLAFTGDTRYGICVTNL